MLSIKLPSRPGTTRCSSIVILRQQISQRNLLFAPENPRCTALRRFVLLRRKLTPRPQPRPIIIQDPNPNDPHDGQTSQQTYPPPHPQIQEQRPRKQNRPRRQRTPRKVIRREQTCRILRVRHGHVNENTLQRQEDTDRVDADPNCGGDPVDFGTRVARPRKEEEADRREERDDHRGDEAAFGGGEALCHDLGHEDVFDVGEVGGDGDGDADQDAQEDQADLSGVEVVPVRDGAVVALAVDDGEDLAG
jgi:hypothetical protein